MFRSLDIITGNNINVYCGTYRRAVSRTAGVGGLSPVKNFVSHLGFGKRNTVNQII